MPSNVALILCSVLVVWFLRIERKTNTAASLALWVPTFWLLITASRPIVRWFNPTIDPMAVVDMEAGSSLDQLMMGGLIFLALLTLLTRRINWAQILGDNRWLLILFLYLGLSIIWSDFPLVSFKRWVRLLSAVPMALVIMSEKSPFDAMESILRRCAYVLIPFSLVLIKYFPDFGREYNIWSGVLSWTGVALQKNSLGILCAVSVCFLAWSFIRRWRSGNLSGNEALILVDTLVFLIAMLLLVGPGGSYSATSLSLMVIGLTLFVLSHKLKGGILRLAPYLKVFIVGFAIVCLSVGPLILPLISSLLGRDETFTGRTDIWHAVLGVAERKPILGVGYGGYWGLGDEISATFHITQAHNGYLEVYLQVGLIGVAFVFAFLLAFCNKITRKLDCEFDWAVFGIFCLLLALLFNFTESSFIIPGYVWTVLVFVTVVFSESDLNIQRN